MKYINIQLSSLFAVLLIWTIPASAQLIPVEQNEKSFFISSAPTMTFLYPGQEAKATLIFLPGGFGHVGIKPTTPASSPYFTRYHFNLMLKRLTNPAVTSGLFNVVIFDNPTLLAQATKYTYPSSRRTSDHLVRIDSVVQHYQNLLSKPIWLIGHSNGAVSITEYYKNIQKNNKEPSVSGLIYSGAIHGADFGENTLLPVLFMHHEKDGCEVTTWQHSQKVFQKLTSQGNTKSEFALLKGGDAEDKDPCISGLHMYFGAEKEAADLIDQFAKKHIQ